MLENLSSTQKAVGGVVVIAGVVGWIFAFVQIGEINSLKSELEPARQGLTSAKDELAQLQGATESLEELTASLAAELLTLLSRDSTLQFKTNARARVRAGPGTDTD